MDALGTKVLLDWIALGSTATVLNGAPAVYPTLADGVTATSHATAWSVAGAIAEIFADTVFATDDFLITDVVLDTISADDDYQLILYTGASGSEVVCANLKFSDASDKKLQLGLRFPKATRLSARLVSKSSSSRTANVSINYRNWRAA